MTEADLLERVSFWQVGLMDVDHLRDVACEALESPFDSTEFRVLAGETRCSTEDARDLLERALQDARDLLERALLAAGLPLPTRTEAERVVAVSIARSVLAGAVDPLWGADFVSHLREVEDGLPMEVLGALIYYSCDCCNGLDEMVDPEQRARRRAECRTEIRAHLREVLPAIEAWAGASRAAPDPVPAGFLGWRRPLLSGRAELKDLGRRIGSVLLRSWDPIGMSEEPVAGNEYDGCIPQVQRILLTVAPEAELADRLREYLRVQQVEPMGLPDSEEAARRREEAVRELLSLRETDARDGGWLAESGPPAGSSPPGP